ncbi:MAG: ABC transporter permease, partial [Gemmatimonadaceae bacterium]
MRRTPGFAAVVVATLAIGVGASTTIFSVVNGVLLKPLPYREPERLVAVWQNNQIEGVDREEPSPANFLDWRERNTSFESIAAAEPYSVSFQTPDGPQREQTWLVSEDFFSALGTAPFLGRGLQQSDFIQGATPALVIGYGLWQRRFGSDRGVIGRREIVDGGPAVIVGVMPPAFAMPPGRDMWAPKIFFDYDKQLRGRTYYQVIGRLKSDVTIAAASSDMARVALQLEREYPRTNTRSGVTLIPLSEQVVGSVRGALALLMGAAGLLLLIACANIANLMLSRAIDRETEFGLRAALGARRGRIIRQLLGESVVFGLAGGALGVALAWGGVATVRGLAPASLPRVSEMDVDPGVLVFALAASLGTAVLFGLLPAIRLGGITGQRTLHGGSARVSGGTRRQRGVRSVLVSAEVALSITLLVGAALLGRSFWSLLHVDKGYRTEGVLTVSTFVYDQYPDSARAPFVRAATAKLKSIPGVIAVGMASDLPLARRITRGDASILLEGQPEPADGQGESVEAAEVSPGFFETLGIRLLAGRVIEVRDDERSLPVVVISATFARTHWPNENPIGRRIRVQQFDKPVMREVVGVVADVRRAGLDQSPGPRIYYPHAQSLNGALAFVIRTADAPEALIPAVRRVFRELAPSLALEQFTTLDGLQAASLQSRRFILALMTTFAITALLLAAIGVFGLLSRVANERTKEFGVRM